MYPGEAAGAPPLLAVFGVDANRGENPLTPLEEAGVLADPVGGVKKWAPVGVD